MKVKSNITITEKGITYIKKNKIYEALVVFDIVRVGSNECVVIIDETGDIKGYDFCHFDFKIL